MGGLRCRKCHMLCPEEDLVYRADDCRPVCLDCAEDLAGKNLSRQHGDYKER